MRRVVHIFLNDILCVEDECMKETKSNHLLYLSMTNLDAISSLNTYSDMPEIVQMTN